MYRREALKIVSVLIGGAVSPSVISGVLSNDPFVKNDKKWKPKFLSNHQNELITTISELIIPETDTPGAKTAGVNEFIDKMLSEWFNPEEKEHFRKGLAEVNSAAIDKFSLEFTKLSINQQVEVLRDFEDRSLVKSNDEEIGTDQTGVYSVEENITILKPFFTQMKELTLVGYYTSEIGITQELKYFVATDNYEGCIEFDSVGGVWSN